jgi:hypothetical protein
LKQNGISLPSSVSSEIEMVYIDTYDDISVSNQRSTKSHDFKNEQLALQLKITQQQ